MKLNYSFIKRSIKDNSMYTSESWIFVYKYINLFLFDRLYSSIKLNFLIFEYNSLFNQLVKITVYIMY